MFTKIQQPEPTLYLAMTYISTSVCNMVLDRCLHISGPKIEKNSTRIFFCVQVAVYYCPRGWSQHYWKKFALPLLSKTHVQNNINFRPHWDSINCNYIWILDHCGLFLVPKSNWIDVIVRTLDLVQPPAIVLISLEKWLIFSCDFPQYIIEYSAR